MTVFPIDPVTELRRLAIELATDRLGIERAAAECQACGYALYRTDPAVRPVDCDNQRCPAADQIAGLQP